MNEKKFLKKLRSENNEDGSFTIEKIKALIDDEKKLLANTSKFDIFKSIFENKRNIKSSEQILSDNFEFILSKIPSVYLYTFFEIILQEDKLKNLVENNFEIILNRYFEEENGLDSFLNYYINECKDVEEFIKKNIDLIIEKTKSKELFKIIQELKGIDSEKLEFLNQKLEENKLNVSESIIVSALDNRLTEDEEKDREEAKEYSQTLLIMIEEVLKNENKRWIDIEQCGTGGYSNVYAIGDKIIKFGIPRETYNIPNHRRILQPLIRTNLVDRDNRTIACIEIQEKVKVRYVKEEELYELYKELRKDGIIWTDARKDNVGRLIKKNKTYLNGEEMYVAPNSVGFDREIKDDELLPGELVVIDLDYIYSRDDSNIAWQDYGLSKKFEARYQREVSKGRTEEPLKEKNQNNNGIER